MRRAFAMLVLISGLSVAVDTGYSQSPGSGWLQRRDPLPPAQGQAPATRLQPDQNQTPTRKRIGPSTAPPTGDNAAYIAFDQGQYLTALRLGVAAAKTGDATAHTLVGRIHAEGLGVTKNPELAAQWYARGAELGDLEAVFSYGVLLATGSGVTKDLEKAAQMFEAAAMKGHPQAHYNLAQLFILGQGKPENPARAALHLDYAAQQGVVPAMYDLATLYQKGVGVEPNAYKAAHWMRTAALRGMQAAKYEYAVMLLRGHGLNQDRPKAIGYLKSSAMLGLPGAQNRLAHVYAEGIDVQQDLVEAAKWRLLAKDGGVEDKELDALVAKLRRDQRRKAEEAARAFQERSAAGIGG
jgi:uncharacterized protein